MINPFAEIIKDESNFNDYIKKLNLIDIFKDVFVAYPEHAKQIIHFIAYAYSIDSDMLFTQGNSWSKVSEEIALKCGLDKDVLDVDTILSSEGVQSSIQKWLQWQNDENWTNYCIFRDLRTEMLISSVSSIKTANGEEINYEQKMKNAIHSKTLLQMMNDARDTFIQNNSLLKTSIDAFNKARTKVKNTIGVEKFAN